MNCKKCGKFILAGSKCHSCGYDSALDTETNANESINLNEVLKPQLGMKWYKFLIYFSLWAGAAINTITAISYLTGTIYLSEGLSADEVYSVFPAMRPTDLIFGVLLFGIVALALVARARLAGFCDGAPKTFYIYIALSELYNVLYSVSVALATETSVLDSVDILSIIITAVYIYLNSIYFKNREHLFTN